MAPIAKAHGVSVARVALAWLLQRKGVMSVIIGAKTIEQLDDNLAAAELTLTPEEIAKLDKASALKPEYPGWMLARQAEGRVPAAEGLSVFAACGRAAISTGGKSVRKVKWGVLGVAKIATEKVIPAMQRGEVSEIAAHRLARPRQGEGRGGQARHRARLRLLRGPARRSRHRGDLQSAAQRSHVPWTVSALEAGKHVLCEKPIALDADEARQLIAARDKSGKLVAEAFMVRFHPQWRRARELARDGTIGEAQAIQTFFSYRLHRPGQCAQPAAGRRRALRHRLLRDPHRALSFSAPSRPASSPRIDRDPKFSTDRLASALLEFPGGRQLDLHRRHAILARISA